MTRRKSLEEHFAQRDVIVTRCKARRHDLLKGNHLNEEVWAEVFGESAFNLDDGWARIFVLDKLGRLLIYKRLRLADTWMEALCSEVASFKAMTKWPRGNLKKSNPWKAPFFHKVVVAAPSLDKVTKQYKVVFPDSGPKASTNNHPRLPKIERRARVARLNRGKVIPAYEGTTVYFKAGYNKAPGMEGWLVPRRQSLHRPWRQSDGSLKSTTPRKAWVPDLNMEELELALEDKTTFIRYLHRKFADDLKERRICAMDIKEFTERLLNE